MAQDLAYSYAGIIKSEKHDDGTLTVYGKATDDSIDLDQQICDADWLKTAMPEWMSSGGNIREQHSNIAAGVATTLEEKADGHYITALVVDPTSVKKVEKGVLKGFSIGIRSPRVVMDKNARGGRIVGGSVIEVSLVDRPANPNAKLMLAKAAETGALEAVNQVNIPTPSAIAKSVIKPVGNTGDKVESMTNKSENPVEEIVEAVAETVEHVAVEAEAVVAEVEAEVAAVAPEVETVVADVEHVAETVETETKSADAEIVKGDIDLYNAALAALAELIKSETDEAVAGEDENKDIKCLLKALKHLQKWHAIEAEKGEVTPLPSDNADEDVDSVDPEDIFLAADKSATPELAINTDSIIEKATNAAKAAVESELELVKSASLAAEERVIELETQLADALSKTAKGGPKRAIIDPATVKANVEEMLVKANTLEVKAKNTTDKTLARGYRDLAADLRKKARKSQKG